MHYRSFINILLEVEVALANYRSTYWCFKDDVVASACLIHYGWQFMFNYPQPLFLKHSNKLYPFITSTYSVHIILLFVKQDLF